MFCFKSIKTIKVGSHIELASLFFKDVQLTIIQKNIVHENYDLLGFSNKSAELKANLDARAYNIPNFGVWWNEAHVCVSIH